MPSIPEISMGDVHLGQYTTATNSMTWEQLMGDWSIKPIKVSPNKKIADLRAKIKMHEGQIAHIQGYIEKAQLDIKTLQSELDKDEKE